MGYELACVFNYLTVQSLTQFGITNEMDVIQCVPVRTVFDSIGALPYMTCAAGNWAQHAHKGSKAMTVKHTDIELTTDASTQYATAYYQGKPCGTVMRKRVYGNVGALEWTAFDMEGKQIIECNFISTAKRAFAKRLNSSEETNKIATPMKYELRVLWNTNAVMQADCTGAMAYDTMQVMFGNFTNITNKRTAKTAGDIPTLDQILKMESGNVFAFTISDVTASVTINITRK